MNNTKVTMSPYFLLTPVIFLIFAGITLHILFIQNAINHLSLNLLLPKTDEFNYHIMASNLMSTNSFAINLPVYPLYVWFLKFIYSIFTSELKYVCYTQYSLTIISTVFIFLSGKRIFGTIPSLLSSLFYIFYKMNFLYEVMRIDTNLSQCLIICTFFLFIHSWQEKSFLSFASYLIIGFFLTTLRIFFIIPVTIGFIYLFLHNSIRSRLIYILTAGICIFLFIYNYSHLHTSDSYFLKFGIHAYLGNNEKSEGIIMKVNNISSTAEGHAKDAIKIAYHESKNKQLVQFFWIKKVLDFIEKKPVMFIKLLIRKINLLVNNYEIANNASIYWFEKYTLLKQIPTLNFSFIFIFSIIGIIFSFRKKSSLPLHIILMIITPVILIFFICSRYRMPLIPFLSLYAGFGVCKLFSLFKTHNFKSLFFTSIIATFLIPWTFHEYSFLNKQNDIITWENRENKKIALNYETKKISNDFKERNNLSVENLTKMTINLAKLKMYSHFFSVIDEALKKEKNNKPVFLRLLKIKAYIYEELFNFELAKLIWKELLQFEEMKTLATHKIEELEIYEVYL